MNLFKILLLTFITSFAYAETTGNLLTNSDFSNGLTGWTNHGSTQEHHIGIGNECDGNAVDTSNSGCGTSGSLATLDNGGVSQTIKLSETTNMTSLDMQNGFSSTMSSDIWFWHGTDIVTMTQTVTGSNGEVNTQSRIITDNHNNYQTYSDTIIIGSNTSTDFDIEAKLDIDDSANCLSHCGPDIDNVTLYVDYTVIPPFTNDVQEELNNITIDDSFINEIIIDEIIADVESFQFDDAFIELEQLDFEEELITVSINEFSNFEEISVTETDIEEIDNVEEIEIAEEETTVIEDEEIEVVEETTEEVANDTIEEETPQGQGLLEEEIETVEDVTEIEAIESDEIEVANKDIRIDINDNITVDIKEITLFSNSNALEVYTKNEFYKPQQIYTEPNDGLFIQADLGLYYKNIYTGITLGNYIDADPISQHNKKLYDLKVQKLQILIDLKKLKGLL
tara:strand:- start:513 stop:1868 length:1356 start_codon:yes stop_codon:yes gene_type:complete